MSNFSIQESPGVLHHFIQTVFSWGICDLVEGTSVSHALDQVFDPAVMLLFFLSLSFFLQFILFVFFYLFCFVLFTAFAALLIYVKLFSLA